ncbi:hypothetical protein GGQ80_002960 [Sphingomonas jinjuensis]|uniref:Uncharacterized protein n=1 Tax=Sphingomonas jinjuensis TaxID=535907 RepID=A0A840F700_9SPHN|nr:SAM-dependent methyltransferase [Sphingomonas jinjuensis]MBB4155043.1 hypothetical protein [Sphingomonas jinjuensis]
MVEPSAGSGSFSSLLPPGSRALDIDPKADGIESRDFLKTSISTTRPLAFIGNPPFSNGMAIRFFNHAAAQAEVIAFILPRSFRKASIQNRLNRRFHLLHEETVENDAFTFCSRPTHVPSIFQIWVRRPIERELRLSPLKHEHFDFVRDPHQADFAVQRVGARAGRVHDDLWLSSQAHYLIRAKIPGVRTVIEALDFDEIICDVAAKPSLAKTELVSLYSSAIGSPSRLGTDSGGRAIGH